MKHIIMFLLGKHLSESFPIQNGGKAKGKRPLVRPRHRWVDNTVVMWIGLDWIRLAEDRNRQKALVNLVLNLWVP
jgi:hypothetical protein